MSRTPEHTTGRERLARWIERHKITQVDTAQLIGMDATQLSQILAGKRRPGLDNAIRIERATGIVVESWVSTDVDDDANEPPERGRKPQIARA